MLLAHLSPLAASLFSLLAIGSLLLAFVMLGSRWLKDYLLAFMAESWLIAALSGAVGYYGNYHELYLIALLTAFFRGLVLPYLIWRIIIRLEVERELHVILQPSSSIVSGCAAGALRLCRVEPSGQRAGSRRYGGRAGAHGNALDETHRLSDAGGPS